MQNVAAKEVVIRRNTSCQPDEYIAHRLGLVPFVFHDDAFPNVSLGVHGREATSKDFTGCDPLTCPYDIPIIKLGPGQCIDLDVAFEKGCGSEHAKYSHVDSVSYAITASGSKLSYETFAGVDAIDYLRRALLSLPVESMTQSSYRERI